MGAIPASFLPLRELWPERVYTLPDHARYPARLNSTEELIDRQVESGHGDRLAILYEDQRVTYLELQAAASRLGSALRALGVEEEDRVLLRASSIPPARAHRVLLGPDRRLQVAAGGCVRPAMPRAPGPAGPGTGKLLRRVLREQAERI